MLPGFPLGQFSAKEGAERRTPSIITRCLPLSEIAHGYDIFKKKKDNCVKVVLDPWQ
jgi:threonine dehydrogenase-like Zn-dependent dehydrogenase